MAYTVKFDKFMSGTGEEVTSLKYGKLVNENAESIPFEWRNCYKTGGYYYTVDGQFRTITDMVGYYSKVKENA